MKKLTINDEQCQVINFALVLYAAQMDTDLIVLKNSGNQYDKASYNAARQRIEIARDLSSKISATG